MRATKLRFTAMTVCCLGMMTLFSSCPFPGVIFVDFEDPALEAIIKNKLSLRLTPVTSVDMLGLTSLDIAGLDIFSLKGLEYALALRFLDASNNPISDIDPLATCVSLESVNLGMTGVFEITSLQNLNNLRTVDLCGAAVPNLLPLLNNTGFLNAGATDSASTLTVDCELVVGPGFEAQYNAIAAGQDGTASTGDDNIVVLCDCEE